MTKDDGTKCSHQCVFLQSTARASPHSGDDPDWPGVVMLSPSHSRGFVDRLFIGNSVRVLLFSARLRSLFSQLALCYSSCAFVSRSTGEGGKKREGGRPFITFHCLFSLSYISNYAYVFTPFITRCHFPTVAICVPQGSLEHLIENSAVYHISPIRLLYSCKLP